MGVASDPFGPPQGDVDPLDDMGIRPECALSLSHNCGRIEAANEHLNMDVAAGATNTLRPLTHSSEATREGSAVHATQLGSSSPLSQDEARPYIVDMLDSIRRQQEALDVNRPRFMLLARKYGLRHREIADLLGMTESGVRQAVHRAKDTPGMEFGGAA